MASVISDSDTPEMSKNLKCNIGNSKDSFRNRIQLKGVNGLLVSLWVN